MNGVLAFQFVRAQPSGLVALAFEHLAAKAFGRLVDSVGLGREEQCHRRLSPRHATAHDVPLEG